MKGKLPEHARKYRRTILRENSRKYYMTACKENFMNPPTLDKCLVDTTFVHPSFVRPKKHVGIIFARGHVLEF